MSDNDGMRADARENRTRILKVARKALRADPAVSLNALAKAAGVGAGTLYRHFPDRESLVLAVYAQEIADLADEATALLAEHAPMEALRLWCERLILFGRMKRGMADVVDAARSSEGVPDAYGPLLAAVTKLLSACEAAGDFLPGSHPEDLLLVAGLAWRLLPGPAGEERTRRLLGVFFRGLRAKG